MCICARRNNYSFLRSAFQILFETAQEYLKLEKMDIGGIKGKTLYAKICNIHEKFGKIYSEFAELQYDILVPEETRFTDHVTCFLAKVRLNYIKYARCN